MSTKKGKVYNPEKYSGILSGKGVEACPGQTDPKYEGKFNKPTRKRSK